MPKLIFKSIDEIFRNAQRVAEAAYAHAVTGAATDATDETGHRWAVYGSCHPEQIAVFEEALRRFPQHTELYAGRLGELFFDVGEMHKALPYLEAATAAEPISNPGIHLPLNHNMLAIIYLTQKKGEDARETLVRGKERARYRNAGTDALLAYAYLLSEKPQAALDLANESLELFLKVQCPDSQIMAHNLAAAIKGRALTADSHKAIAEYYKRADSFEAGVRDRVTQHLNEIHGTTDPVGLVELTPTSKFEHLQWLKHGTYDEPID
ncbi:hypothetical protein HY642_00570 [Candidatus Woesearchaeota archaeon]|nr:hypothetical protein [Candidatus Woesearchaeota archaeon]